MSSLAFLPCPVYSTLLHLLHSAHTNSFPNCYIVLLLLCTLSLLSSMPLFSWSAWQICFFPLLISIWRVCLSNATFLCRSIFKSCSCCSVAQSCLTLCDPMDCSTPGSSVLHYLLEFAQIPVHWVSDAIWPSHPLLLPSPFTLIFPGIRVFSSELALCIRWPKYWSFSNSSSSEHSGLISFRIDWFDLLTIQGTLQESSPAPRFESINSLALSLLYDPTLTSVHDYWTIVLTIWTFIDKGMSLFLIQCLCLS